MTVRCTAAKLMPIVMCSIIFSVPLSAQREDSRPGSGMLYGLVPEIEQNVLQLREMPEEQRRALATLLAGYYFAGLNDAVQDGTVSGSFEGWDGDTLVELTDGSVFRQTEYHYEYQYSYRPDVTIYLSPFSYELLVEDTDEAVEAEMVRSSRRLGSHFERHQRFHALLGALPQEVALRALSISAPM